MPTNPSGLFSHPISADMLMSGLIQEPNMARDKNFLAQSDNAVGYAGSLATVPDLSERKLSLIGIPIKWPFPQIVQCQRMYFVFTQSSIYMWANNKLRLMWSGAENYRKWAASDYITFIIMSNGLTTLRYDASTDALIPVERYNASTDEGTPHFAACLNYNGQLLIGGVNNGIK